MYKDYLDAIVRFYHLKKDVGGLPARFRNPSPANLRDECVDVYKSRFNNHDEPTLILFFGTPRDGNMLKAIENVDIDKFRPLGRFIRLGDEDPADRTKELLGWLVDFPARPFDRKVNYEGMFLEESDTPDSGSKGAVQGGGRIPTSGDDGEEEVEGSGESTGGIGNKDTGNREAGYFRKIEINGKKWLVAAILILIGCGYWASVIPTFAKQQKLLPETVQAAGLSGSDPASTTKAPLKKDDPPGTRNPQQKSRPQCLGITKKGTRCKHYPAKGAAYCWQHEKKSQENLIITGL